MARKFILPAFLFAAVLAVAQKKQSLEKKLDIFWKAKHIRANAIVSQVAFHPGDTVADIGTADGWFMAVLSTFTDSLTFYLEDIDSAGWNRPAFDSAVQHFSTIRNKKASHRFHYTKGEEKITGLPHNIFHKVFIIDTYHHFKYRVEMLQEVFALLKPGGKIIVLEALARKPGDFHQGCKEPIFSEEEIITHFKSHDLTLEKVTPVHKIAGRPNKLFVFVKKSS